MVMAMGREFWTTKKSKAQQAAETQAQIRKALSDACDGVLFGVPEYHPWLKILLTVGIYAPSGRPLVTAYEAAREPKRLFELTMRPPSSFETELTSVEWLSGVGAPRSSGLLESLRIARIAEPTGRMVKLGIVGDPRGELVEVWRWTLGKL